MTRTSWVYISLGGIVLAVVSLTSGIYIGSTITGSISGDLTLSNRAHDFPRDLLVLRTLRAGKVDSAIAILENKLDDDVLILRASPKHSKLTHDQLESSRLLVRDYRREYPWVSPYGQDVNGPVAGILEGRSP